MIKARSKMLTKTRVAEILEKLRDRFVVVLGDLMLDEFVWGDVTNCSATKKGCERKR
jgi:hypothetical protein